MLTAADINHPGTCVEQLGCLVAGASFGGHHVDYSEAKAREFCEAGS
jgi:hypothetical protein